MSEFSLFLALTFVQNGAINMYTNTHTYRGGASYESHMCAVCHDISWKLAEKKSAE